MYQKVTDYLKSYMTVQDIPLHQILTPSDIHHIAATVTAISKPKGEIQFEDTYNRIFEPLGEKGEKIIDNQILSLVFELNDTDTPAVKIMELAFYCLMYLKCRHDLPLERVIELVTAYMQEMIVPSEQTRYSINKAYPVSNLVQVSDNEFVRTNGLKLVPPTEAISLNFINKIKQLLIP